MGLRLFETCICKSAHAWWPHSLRRVHTRPDLDTDRGKLHPDKFGSLDSQHFSSKPARLRVSDSLAGILQNLHGKIKLSNTIFYSNSIHHILSLDCLMVSKWAVCLLVKISRANQLVFMFTTFWWWMSSTKVGGGDQKTFAVLCKSWGSREGGYYPFQSVLMYGGTLRATLN
jgi:hypothetical protein